MGLASSFLLAMSLRSRSHHHHLDLPSGPPPEVWPEIDEAWERAQRPLADGLILDFESEPALGRAWGVLRRADGSVVERISATQALAMACGDAMVEPGVALAV
jgi:hypothetical protein